MLVGCDGGFYVTYDRMDHWDFLNHDGHRPVLPRRRRSTAGRTTSTAACRTTAAGAARAASLHGTGPINEDWIVVSGGDGFVCRVDPTDPDLVYSEIQDGSMCRRNLRTGESGLHPARTQPRAQPPYRFNWNTPFILSQPQPAASSTAAATTSSARCKQGDDLQVISPEITRTKRGSATALAESPRNPDVLWAGTDDGDLWVTRDGGKKWTNVADKVGLPGPRWVASIEASRCADGRAYVVFDAHRSDDDEPYVYVTEDFGETWKSLRGQPAGRLDARAARGHRATRTCSTWAPSSRSTRRSTAAASWTKINNNLPTVAVHEIAQHPTAGEIVAATHGRSLWVLDVTALRQMTADALKAKAQALPAEHGRPLASEPQRGTVYGTGSRHFVGENPPSGAQIYYSLTKKAEKISLKVLDYAGKTVATLARA